MASGSSIESRVSDCPVEPALWITSVNHEMRHVDALWRELACQALGESAKSKLLANGADSGYPLTLADAPVRRIAPCRFCSMRRAAC